ncbi:MAG: glycosyltransferase [Thermoflavifilum sp.]|uniref:glycosyltransferase n=1 Tax=Thermoflavifilum sp. TaxID=1968839 RepID=UPI0018A4BFD4|nr:glycosyltransferase [Thermoflavifilum sp.]QOR75219.1 MAG: glycosyltransferase [Thermoflavifilum sp.]
MCARKNILWLVSWYPDREQPVNGDFIERHALVASTIVNVIVLHIAWDAQLSAARIEKDDTHAPHLMVYRWYDAPSTCSITWLRKLHQFWKYFRGVIQGFRTIQQAHTPLDCIHVHVCWKAGLTALCLKWLSGKSYLLSEHASYFQPASPHAYWQDHPWKRWMIRLILRGASLWLPVSENLGHHMQTIAGRKQVYVLPNAVDTSLFTYREAGYHREFRTFIHVSDLQPHKRPGTIIAAFEQVAPRLPEWRLLLVGPIRNDVKHRWQQSPYADRIYFTGWLKPPEVAMHLQHADVFVLYSDYENQPCALLEALCCGLPVVASSVGGIAEVVNERNGRLIPPNNLQVLSDALLDVANRIDDFDRVAISLEARTRFGYPAIAEHFRRIYTAYCAS